MHRSIVFFACALMLTTAGSALAADTSAPPDMSKMGPWARKPTNEAKTKKEIRAFYREQDQLWNKRDFDATLKSIDFPVFMFTDDAKTGAPSAGAWNKATYIAQMKPSWDSAPKDMAVTHKLDITVLSDSLVTYVDDFTVTVAGKKMGGKSSGVLVKINGQWKYKVMGEAGWGGAPQ